MDIKDKLLLAIETLDGILESKEVSTGIKQSIVERMQAIDDREWYVVVALDEIEKLCIVCGEKEGKSMFCRQCCDECDTNEHTYEVDNQ